ncbi:hypothetical protein IMZ11_15325 [Microtetraspora sp. AC03309]|uniref:hypothetical protein n=1 Tax=Microtetraspora sp. AC03309 TaxID=2779376 RepID=UPI001E37DABD|nr:hypothetical protein [Microtetraspora sp. AC03309]MCC5576999.1 hypothetical protein [Microtetraspora sp. AC03309]
MRTYDSTLQSLPCRLFWPGADGCRDMKNAAFAVFGHRRPAERLFHRAARTTSGELWRVAIDHDITSEESLIARGYGHGHYALRIAKFPDISAFTVPVSGPVAFNDLVNGTITARA